jgi:hypothetical protein
MPETKSIVEAVIELRETRPVEQTKGEGVAVMEGQDLSTLNLLLAQIKNQADNTDGQSKKAT